MKNNIYEKYNIQQLKNKIAELEKSKTSFEQNKITQDRVKENEKQFQTLFNSMREGFALCEVICDKKGIPIDYRFLKINPAFEKQSGMNAATSVGKTIKEIYPDIESKWIERYCRVGITQEAIHFEDYNHNTDKYYDVISFSPSKGKFAMIFRDITKQKKADLALQESEERLKIIFELAPDAIYLTDLKGIFIDGNKTAEDITGYKRKELIGKSFLKLKLLKAKDLLKVSKLLIKNVQGKGTGPDEFILNRKDDGQVPVEISTYPVKIKNKIVVLGIARDITERKRAEEKLISRNKELELYNEVTVGRELKMLELKKEINELLEKSGEKPKYKIPI